MRFVVLILCELGYGKTEFHLELGIVKTFRLRGRLRVQRHREASAVVKNLRGTLTPFNCSWFLLDTGKFVFRPIAWMRKLSYKCFGFSIPAPLNHEGELSGCPLRLSILRWGREDDPEIFGPKSRCKDPSVIPRWPLLFVNRNQASPRLLDSPPTSIQKRVRSRLLSERNLPFSPRLET